MKKIVLLFICLSIFQFVKGQNRSMLFEEYIHAFPYVEYPYIISFDSEKATPIKSSVKLISKELSDPFVRDNIGIIKECDDEYYFGIMAIGRFNTDTNAFYMVFVSYDMETGCEDKGYLITYSPQGKTIDTLLILNHGKISGAIDQHDRVEYFYLEGTIISKQEIDIFCKERIGLIEYENGKKKRRIRVIKNIYTITPEGKFEKEESFVESDEMEEFR